MTSLQGTLCLFLYNALTFFTNFQIKNHIPNSAIKFEKTSGSTGYTAVKDCP